MFSLLRRAALAALLALPLAGPAAAQDFTLIKGNNEVERGYGPDLRGWRILSAEVGGRFAFCSATSGRGDARVRIGYDGDRWQVAVPVALPGGGASQDVRIEVDGDSWAGTGFRAGDWTVVPLRRNPLDAVRNGQALIVDIGSVSAIHSLEGSAAAMAKVAECVENRGTVPPPRPAAVDRTQQLGSGCPARSALVNRPGNAAATVEFYYELTNGRALQIYGVDRPGRLVRLSALTPSNPYASWNTRNGYVYVVKDGEGRCYGGMVRTVPGANVFLVR